MRSCFGVVAGFAVAVASCDGAEPAGGIPQVSLELAVPRPLDVPVLPFTVRSAMWIAPDGQGLPEAREIVVQLFEWHHSCEPGVAPFTGERFLSLRLQNPVAGTCRIRAASLPNEPNADCALDARTWDRGDVDRQVVAVSGGVEATPRGDALEIWGWLEFPVNGVVFRTYSDGWSDCEAEGHTYSCRPPSEQDPDCCANGIERRRVELNLLVPRCPAAGP